LESEPPHAAVAETAPVDRVAMIRAVVCPEARPVDAAPAGGGQPNAVRGVDPDPGSVIATEQALLGPRGPEVFGDVLDAGLDAELTVVAQRKDGGLRHQMQLVNLEGVVMLLDLDSNRTFVLTEQDGAVLAEKIGRASWR